MGLPRVRWRGLRTRIVAWSFVPTAIILVAVALVTFYAYQQVTEDLVVDRNRELTRLLAGQLAAELQGYADLLGAVARTADVRQSDPAIQRAALRRAANRLLVFDAGAIVLNSHGVVTAAEPPRPDALGQDWSDRPYFRQMLRASGAVVSDVLPDGPGGAEVVLVAVPISGDEGELAGLLAGLFRLGATEVSSFYGSVVKLRLGQIGSAYLVDASGRVIYHSDPDLGPGQVGASLADQPLVQQVLGGRVGAARARDAAGQEIVASYAPVPGTSWGLVAEESWSELSASSRGYARFLLLLLLLGVVVPSLVVLVGVTRITRPVAELIAAAREVAEGNFGRSIATATHDELADLAEQFNRMSAQLQESYANLERRVADRTRELATLNAISSAVNRSLDLEVTLRDALDETLRAARLASGLAYRLEPDGRTLVLTAHHGISAELAGSLARLEYPEALPRVVVAELRPVSRAVGTLRDPVARRQLGDEGITSIVVVPLVAKGRIVGAMVLNDRGSRSFTAEELALFHAVGQQVGVAVENARLYENAEEAAAAAERNRLARDLHDAVTQTLFSASLIAEVLPRIWERSPEDGRRRLEELRQLTRGALAEMRTLLLELRPSALTEAPIGNLLRQLAEATTGRARLPVTVTLDGQRPLPPDVQVALYRIAQEALNNVAKHSGARQAHVALRCADDSQVELAVGDDGRGFDPAQVSPDHLGTGIMRERAQAIGAHLQIQSAPGQGTRVVVTWPA